MSARPCSTVQHTFLQKTLPLTILVLATDRKEDIKEEKLFSFLRLPLVKSGVNPLIPLGVMTHNGCGQCVPKDIFLRRLNISTDVYVGFVKHDVWCLIA